jgi:hypothetical protein
MLAMNAFDTICQEHLEYYTLKQISWLCDKHDLRIMNVLFNDVNGGSFLVVVCHDDLDFKGFNHRVQERKDRLMMFLRSEKEAGRSIHLYGASTKGNVLLQTFGIDHQLVSFAAERNPEKYGCWTPGTHIPIVSEEESRRMNPDIYLVLPWHFRDSFVDQMKEYLMQGGTLVFPLPDPEIVSMEDGEIVLQSL